MWVVMECLVWMYQKHSLYYRAYYGNPKYLAYVFGEG